MLLAGDAAHLSPPFVGQGLGLGLRDVHQLAWKLADVLTGTAAEELLDTYQAEREPHARALIGVARLLGRLMTGGGRAGSVLRRGVLAAVRRIPAVERAGDRQPHPAAAERAARRAARAVPDDGWPGSLLPQPEVLLDGRPCRLDDVLGDGEAEVRRDGERLVVVRTDGSRGDGRGPEPCPARLARARPRPERRGAPRPDRALGQAVSPRLCARAPNPWLDAWIRAQPRSRESLTLA